MAKQSYIVGRAGDIVLCDDTVSRRHARFELESDRLSLVDLDSRNGTYELKDNKLLRFEAGEVEPDQVFVFGECVRSVAQLIVAVDELSDHGKNLARRFEEEPVQPSDDPMETTHFGIKLPPGRRLSSTEISGMLAEIDGDLGAGQRLAEICRRIGISEQRYRRWCREYGEKKEDPDALIDGLRRENERLRRMVTDLTLRYPHKKAINNN